MLYFIQRPCAKRLNLIRVLRVVSTLILNPMESVYYKIIFFGGAQRDSYANSQ